MPKTAIAFGIGSILLGPPLAIVLGTSLSVSIIICGIIGATLISYGVIGQSEDTADSIFFSELGQVRNSETTLIPISFARCEVRHTLFTYFSLVTDSESGRAALVEFENLARPRRVAKGVAAKITYVDSKGLTIVLDGRWADTDQPSPDLTKSSSHLLRVDFGVGERHWLDIAAQMGLECYAVNNESWRNGIRDPARLLIGPTIKIAVHLLAEHVDQTFHFEVKTHLRKLEIVPA